MRIFTSARRGLVQNCRTFCTAAPSSSQFVTWPANLAAGGMWAIGTVYVVDKIIAGMKDSIKGEFSRLEGELYKLEARIVKVETSMMKELNKEQVKQDKQMAKLQEQLAMILSKLDGPATH